MGVDETFDRDDEQDDEDLSPTINASGKPSCCHLFCLVYAAG
jgi:hypothetical protein